MTPYKLYITAKNGHEATVTGQQAAIEAVVDALKKAGAVYNEEVETWDFGFYNRSSNFKGA